jgi:iron-sulfur cluster assembly protein
MKPFHLTLTESAKAHYLGLLQKNPGAIGVRFFTKKAGCSGLLYQSELVFEENIDDYTAIQEENLKIFISPKSMPYLEGMRVDFVKKGLGQSQVVYENPNEIARCGCGESFKVRD